MMTQTFEIKVALLGYVSVGKTTVLNALLQDKFSEVSMRRTTAGVSFFRVVNQTSGKDDAVDAKGEQPKATANDEVEWSPLADEPVLMATSVLTEITQDNKMLREEKRIQEKSFNVELSNPLCQMRKDTSLVFVDVPGLNEAESKQMYLTYVSQKWSTFDCVIIVMDAEKGVNTEEQVQLLKFVKEKLEADNNIPVIVLCNKVDDPDDDEVMELVGEVRTKVEQIFKVNNRSDSLNQLVAACREGKRCSQASLYPVFIPLSAGNAFAYRTAARCSFENFKELDLKLLDKIGRDEVGKNKWKKLPLDEKHTIVSNVMRDAERYHEYLEATNFDKLLMALAYSIGGHEVQLALLEKQVQVDIRNLTGESTAMKLAHCSFYWRKLIRHHWESGSPIVRKVPPIVRKVQSIFDRCRAVGCDPAPLKAAFWKVFGNICKAVVDHLQSNVDPSDLADTFEQLIAYRDFARKVGWKEEEGQIVGQMIALVRQQIGLVLEQESTWTIDANNMHFCERFGREKIMLETLFQRHTFYSTCLADARLVNRSSCNNACLMIGKTAAEKKALANIALFSQGNYVNGEFVPKDPVKYSLVCQVVAPELISDRSHWGHVIWKFCKFMDQAESSAA